MRRQQSLDSGRACAQIFLVLFAVLDLQCLGKGASVATERMFPAGELKLERDQLTSSSFVLRIRNLNPYLSTGEHRTGTHTYLVAGASGRIPDARLLSARYSLFYEGAKVETREDTPPSSNSGSTTVPVVRISEAGVFRHLQVYSLGVTVSQSAPESSNESLYVLESMELLVDLGPPPRTDGPSNLLAEEVVSREVSFTSAQVINADIDRAYWVYAENKSTSAAQEWVRRVNAANDAGPVFKIPVYDFGIYRLPTSDLTKMSGRSLPPTDQWRLFSRGVERPLVELSDNDLYLIPDPAQFQVPGEEVYWLFTGSSVSTSSSVPLRIEPAAGATTGTLVTSGLFEVSAEGLSDYHARLRPTPLTTRWFWKGLVSGDAEVFPIPLPTWYKSESGTSPTLHVHYGLATHTGTLPRIRVYLNGIESGTTTATVQQGVLSFSLDADLVTAGNNRIGIRAEYPEGVVAQDVLVQKLRLSWEQRLSDNTTGLRFKVPANAGAGDRQLRIARESGKKLEFVAFTPSGTQIFVPATETDNLLYPSAANANQYLLLEAGKPLPVPPNIQLVAGLPPLPETGGEYLVVFDDSLSTAIQPLLEYRRSTGLSTFATAALQVFDQFSYGNRDGEAIRNLVLHLWGKGDVKPTSLLLVGESSDFRGDPRLLPPGAQRDMVPTIGPPAGEGMRGDHGFGSLFGQDSLLDLGVGRLSVRNADELSSAVEKIIAFEAAPAGGWSRHCDFFMDDNEEFPSAVNHVVTRGTAPPANVRLFKQADFAYDFNMRVPGRKRSRVATREAIDLINSGAGMLTFFGHGGPNLWSHERLLHLQDLPLIQNGTRLPLITCASCDNAWIDYPVPPVNESMGELLVKKGDGGAIGVFGPVAGASPFEHSTLVRRLMEGVYRKGLRRMGEATLYAKNMYFAETRSATVPEQYLLIGDPAVTIKAGEMQPLVVTPRKIYSDEAAALKVRGRVGQVDGGHLLLRNQMATEAVTSAPYSARPLVIPPLSPGGYVAELSAETPVVSAARVEVIPRSETPQNGPPLLHIRETSGPLQNIRVWPLVPMSLNGPVTARNAPVLRFGLQNNSSEILTGTAQLFSGAIAFSQPVPINSTRPNDLSRLHIPCERPLDPGPTSLSLTLRSGTSTAVYDLTFNVLQPVNLQFVPGSARAWGASPYFIQRETVFFSARLRNTGGVTARNILAHVLTDPGNSEAGTINDQKAEVIDRLEPGEETQVVFRWEDANSPGRVEPHLWVNRGRTIPENDYSDNSISLPTLEIRPVRNYSIADFRVSPTTVSPGEALQFRMEFFDSIPLQPQSVPVDIEYGFRNDLTGLTTSTREVLPRIKNGQSHLRDMILPPGFTTAFATINASREAEELTVGDSSVVHPLQIIADLPEGASNQTFDLKGFFEISDIDNLDAISTGALAMSADFTSSTEKINITAENVTSGSVAIAKSQDNGEDNAWLLHNGNLQALSSENAGPIHLRFENIVEAALDEADLYAWIIASHENSRTWGQFDLQLSDGKWQHFDFASQAGPHSREVYLGRIQLSDSSFSVSIRQTSGSSVSFDGFVLRPRASALSTPILKFAKEKKTPSLLQASGYAITPRNVVLQARFGEDLQDTRRVLWSEWKSVKGTQLEVPSGISYLQVRIYFKGLDGRLPVLHSLELRQR